MYRDYEHTRAAMPDNFVGLRLDCSFIMTQIIQTGTISDNIEFSFTTASANAYLHKA